MHVMCVATYICACVGVHMCECVSMICVCTFDHAMCVCLCGISCHGPGMQICVVDYTS